MTKEDRIKKIIHEAARELNGIMTVTPTQAAKDVVKKAMGRSVRSKDPMFWPAGMLMLGLAEAAAWCENKAASGDEAGTDEKYVQVRDAILHAVTAHMSLWKNRYHESLDFVDDALAGVAFVRLYKITNDMKYKEAADRIADFLDKAPRDFEGAVIYNGSRSRNIFVDGTGQVSMFYAAYSSISEGYAEYLDKAVEQLVIFSKFGMDRKSGLNYHGYELRDAAVEGFGCEKKGLLGWGRAFGWLLLGLSETCVELSKKVGPNGALIQWYRQLAALAVEYQREDGGFSWQIQAVEGHIDMSATGMIAYALERGISAGILDEVEGCREAVLKARHSMYEHSSKGIVTEALSSCDDFSVHYQTYGNYPWGQGAVLMALTGE